jgi:Lon protease-like protein
MSPDKPADARRLAMFPLGTVLFPGEILPLHVFEPRYRQMMTDCTNGDGSFGVVLISRGSEVGGGDQRVAIGTEARIEEASRFADGRWGVLARGVHRIVIETWLPDDPYPCATVRSLPTAPDAADHASVAAAAGAVRRARALLSELGRVPAMGDLPPVASVAEDPDAPIWSLCAAAPLGPMDRQRLLEIDAAAERVSILTGLSLELTEDLHRLLSGEDR